VIRSKHELFKDPQLVSKLKRLTGKFRVGQSVMLSQLIRNNSKFISFIYYNGEKIIGWATLQGDFVNIFVHGKYRKKGIASILLKEVYFYSNINRPKRPRKLFAYPGTKGGITFFGKHFNYTDIETG